MPACMRCRRLCASLRSGAPSFVRPLPLLARARFDRMRARRKTRPRCGLKLPAEMPRAAWAASLCLGCALSSAGHCFDLAESWREAAAGNAELAASGKAAHAERLEAKIARGELYPRFGIRISARDTARLSNGHDQLRSGHITLAQPIWNPSIGPNLKQADKRGELAALEHAQAETRLLADVVKAYFDVLAAQDSLETGRTEISSIEVLLKYSLDRRDAGLSTKFDVERSQARLALAKAKAVAAENDLEVAWLRFSELVGQRPETLSALDERAPLGDLMQDAGLQRWIDAALAGNTDLAMQKAKVEMARLQIETADSDSQPSLSFSARVSDRFSGSDDISEKGYAEIILSKSFSSGQVDANRRLQARLRHEAETELLRRARTQLVARTTQAFKEAASLRIQLDALRLAVAASEAGLEAARSSFSVGLAISLEVIEAERDYFEAQRQLQSARYDYLNSFTALKHVAGDLDESDIKRLNDFLL